jgi:hypothetical protein
MLDPTQTASPIGEARVSKPRHGGADAEEPDPFVEFQALYRDWLSARAACADFTSDQEMTVRARRRDAAELALLAMPAPNPECFFIKWEVLERLVAYDAEEGQLTNNRTTLALGAVKADLLRFGLKHRE